MFQAHMHVAQSLCITYNVGWLVYVYYGLKLTCIYNGWLQQL